MNDLLKARIRDLEEERRRERVLQPRFIFPSRSRQTKADQPEKVPESPPSN